MVIERDRFRSANARRALIRSLLVAAAACLAFIPSTSRTDADVDRIVNALVGGGKVIAVPITTTEGHLVRVSSAARPLATPAAFVDTPPQSRCLTGLKGPTCDELEIRQARDWGDKH